MLKKKKIILHLIFIIIGTINDLSVIRDTHELRLTFKLNL